MSYVLADYQLDPATRELRAEGAGAVRLEPKAFELLEGLRLAGLETYL